MNFGKISLLKGGYNSLFLDKIRKIFLSNRNREINFKLDLSNLTNIYFISLVVFIAKSVALIIYLVSKYFSYNNGDTYLDFYIDLFCAVLCLVVCILSGAMRKSEQYVKKHHRLINAFVGLLFVLFLIWGMFASELHYIRGQQIITFYIVELCVVMFVKLRPLVSTHIILFSYAFYYFLLNYYIKPGGIDGYSFLMMSLFSAAVAIANYKMTVNNIRYKLKIEILNKSFMLIAEHDVVTRLKNRYSLNQKIPDYLQKKVCVALGDIDKFKSINDSLGHNKGDDVLKYVSDNFIEIFGKESVYRYGGDEFLVVSVSDDYDSFVRKLDDFNKKIANSDIVKDGIHCTFGSVCGEAITPIDFSNMISEADSKLYIMKDKNRN